MTMETIDVCRAIHAIRGDAVVVTTMSAMRAMDQVAPDARLALSAVPLMGGSAGLALGIALAQPSRKLIVIDGDASLLMELGVLATVGGAAGGAVVGNRLTGGTTTVWVVNVRFDDGTNANIEQDSQPPVWAGERVRVRNGRLERIR